MGINVNKTDLDSILDSVSNYNEIPQNQDIIFEGHGEKDISGKVVSQHGCTPTEIAKIASKINKPKNWNGHIVLLGSQTAELTGAVAYEYYKLTNKNVTVIGPKGNLIIESVNNDQSIIGVSWAEDDPDKPDYINFAKKDIFALDKLVCGIENKLNNFDILFDEFFKSVTPTYKTNTENLKAWFNKLSKIRKLLSENIKYLDLIIPCQDLDEDSTKAWEEVLSLSKSILSLLLEFSDKSKYTLTDENDMDKMIDLNEISCKLNHTQKETLPHLFLVAENLIRIFKLSMIKESLDLSNPDMVNISTYTG